MLKLSWFLFALSFHLVSESFTIKTIGTSETNLKCPPSAEAETTCQCDEMTSSVHCNGVTYQYLEIFFDKLKLANPDGVHVNLFRMENYINATLDVIIFTPCTSHGRTFFCDEGVELVFGTIDLSGNKDLKYIGSMWRYDAGIIQVNVQIFLVSDCSLSDDDDHRINYNFFYNGLSMFGIALEYLDFSQNYLTGITLYSHNFNWPNLLTFNMSNNQISDFSNAWLFEGAPNVDVIDLSHNFIQNFEAFAYTINDPYPHKMEMEIIFDLSNNRLTQNSTFRETLFTFSRRPTRLVLNQNYFSHLPQLEFQSFMNRQSALIDMSINQLFCDCQSEWLRSGAVIYESRMINYDCLNLNNISIFKIKESLCGNCC